ncbi:MAG: hypothetical protein V1743_04115 [Nanoarchaeota archaeon]
MEQTVKGILKQATRVTQEFKEEHCWSQIRSLLAVPIIGSNSMKVLQRAVHLGEWMVRYSVWIAAIRSMISSGPITRMDGVLLMILSHGSLTMNLAVVGHLPTTRIFT